jgi:hypothetical protein
MAQRNENMTSDLRDAIRADLAAVVSDLSDSKATNAEGRTIKANAAAHLRAYAAHTADAGVAVADGADLLNAAWKATGKAAGTIKPYVGAFRGYRAALVEGVNIDDTSNGEKENPVPLSVPKAREFLESPEKRAENARFAAIRAEIAARVRAITDYADLVAFRDMLPEAEGEVTTTEPSVDDLLAGLLGRTDGQGQAQPARRAAVH